MTRTRQSPAQGTRGAPKREGASLEKVEKPKTSSATSKAPTKGRYACGQCKKFEGPRRSVEDHCKMKHKLTGDRLQKAIQLAAEIIEMAAGSSREQPSPQRTSKRQRNQPVDSDADEEAGRPRPKREKIDIRQTDDGQKDGEKVMTLSPSVEEARGKVVARGKSPEDSEPASVISTQAVTQGTMAGTCEKCKRTFPRPRQMMKHKCFPVEDKKPKPGTPKRDQQQSPLKRQKNTPVRRPTTYVMVKSLKPTARTNLVTKKETDQVIGKVQNVEAKKQVSTASLSRGVGDWSMSSDVQNIQVDENDSLEEDQNVESADEDVTASVEVTVSQDSDTVAQERDPTVPPQEGSKTPKVTEIFPSITSECVTHSSSDTDSSFAAGQVIENTAHTPCRLPPVSTLLSPQGTPGGTCSKCKRSFSRARQMIKHKCFAGEEDEPEQKVQASSRAKSPRGTGSPTKKLLMKLETPASPRKADQLSVKLSKISGNPMTALPTRLDTLIPKLSENLGISLESSKKLIPGSDRTSEAVPSSSPKTSFFSESPEHGYCLSKSPKESKEPKKERKKTVKVENSDGTGSNESVMSALSSLAPPSNVVTPPVITKVVALPVPTIAGPYTAAGSPAAGSPRAGTVAPRPTSVVETPNTANTTETDVKSPREDIIVQIGVGDVPLGDLLNSLEESSIGGTRADDSAVFEAKATELHNASMSSEGSNVDISAAFKVPDSKTNTESEGSSTKLASAETTEVEGEKQQQKERVAGVILDVQAGSTAALQMSEEQELREYEDLRVKHDQIDATQLGKIEESILLQTAEVDAATDDLERTEDGILQGRTSFCLCSFCGLETLDPDEMMEHLCLHVTDYRPFRCESCTFLASYRRDVEAHVMSTHGGPPEIRQDPPNTSEAPDSPNAVQATDVKPRIPPIEPILPTKPTDDGGSDQLADDGTEATPDVQGEVASPMPKQQKLSKYAKLAIKQEQIDATEQFKIEESILLRTAQVAFTPDVPEKVQVALQNGKSFCLCSFCGQITLNQDRMKEHLTLHVKDYLPFKCESCDFLSRKRGRVTVHKKSAHGGFLKCECCDYTTYDKDKLARHYKYWNRDFNNSCKFCHKKIVEGTKEDHLKSVHGKTTGEIASINLTADAFTCRHCGKKMKSRHARRDHEKRHEPHYLCPLCPYTTNGESAFINHGRKHRVVLVCSVCLEKFHSSHALKEHLHTHAGPEIDVETLYEKSVDHSIFVGSMLDEASIPECDIIGLDMGMRVREEERRVDQKNTGIFTPRPVARAVTVQEMKDMKFGPEYDCFVKNVAYRHLTMSVLSFMFARYGKRECTHCGFLLHSLGSWRIHVGSHEGKQDHQCAECDYKCRHKFLLERHIMITHMKKDFACDICDKRFPYREYVYLHKRKDHEGGRMKCSYCTEVPFETEEEKVMKRHIIEEHPEMTSTEIAQIIGRKVHFTGSDGILFVKCKYCQKGFNRAAFLRQHVQTVHMKKKQFQCEKCDYKSSTRARLRTHMAVHTNVRDITCDECGAGFKNKVYLYKHIRRSHKRYATTRGADYCKRTRLKNVISLLQKERQEGSSYERQEIIQKEKAKLLGNDRSSTSVQGVGVSLPTQINVFQCGDCGEYFENIFTLKNHFMFVHGESPNIPMDLEAAATRPGSKKEEPAPADPEQISIAMDALKNSVGGNTLEQLYQCAKCNRMFPDIKSIEHHVKEVHATDVFLISEEGDIPSHELDLAAEVINQLTLEAGQSGPVSVMESVISQSTIDALNQEAQNAAAALTSLPDAVLEMETQSELVSMNTTFQEDQPGHRPSEEALQGGEGAAANQQEAEQVVRTEQVERTEEMEAAHLLQQMGVFQQQFSFNNTSGNPTEAKAASASDSMPVAVTLPTGDGEAQGEGNLTIVVLEEGQQLRA